LSTITPLQITSAPPLVLEQKSHAAPNNKLSTDDAPSKESARGAGADGHGRPGQHSSSAVQSQPHQLSISPSQTLKIRDDAIENELVEDVVPDPESPSGDKVYTHAPRRPEGKEISRHSKEPAPVDLGTNIDVDDYVQQVARSFKDVNRDAATTVKELVKEKWGVDIDPNTTFIVTYKYNTNAGKPYPAQIVSKISLTQAFIQNSQNIPGAGRTHVPYYRGGPDIKLVDKLESVVSTISDFGSRANPGRESAHVTHTYQGVYVSAPSKPDIYSPATQLPFSVDDLKSAIKNSDFQRSHTEFLNDFWDKNSAKYPTLVKASLVKAAHAQTQEGTLADKDKQLLMRGIGLDPDQPAWADTPMESLLKPPSRDPDVETGLLTIGRYPSTDIMVITDKKGEVKNGKTIHRTLLYIPGNSSPIHSFDSPEEMKATLAQWAADPVKREALLQHFKLKERNGSEWHAGIIEALKGLGAWPKPGHRYKWNPDKEIKIEPYASPFTEVSERQRSRSYADADLLITSKNDVIKKEIEKFLNKAAMVALLFTPFAFLMPEVTIVLDVLAITSGAVEAGIGAVDVAHGKPGGVEKLVFGVLNATLPVLARGIGGEGPHITPERPLEPVEPSLGVEPETPIESVPERVSPGQGANRVDNQTPTAKGTGTIALKREVGPDGQSVLVPDGIWAEKPKILRREKYTDVVVGDKVYRFDPSKPDVLTEVGAETDFEPLAGFEMKCGSPGARMGRDLNGLCYTKWIEPGGTPVYQEAQALEHRRLVPSPEVSGQPRTVVHDHRLYQVDPNNGDQLIEVPRQSPITYRNQVTGSIVNEPDFGFDKLGQFRPINNDTVVVKLGPISDLSDDQRTLRGYKTQYNGKNYVVAEGDTGVFYCAELNASGQLDFQRITANNNPVSSRIIELHDQYKDIHGYAANGTPNQDIVVLPGMDDLVKNIAIDNNLSPAETQQLKNVLSGLSDEKQRELLLNIRAWGKKLNVPTALKPIALEPMNIPATFNSLSPADKNKFFAEASREAIDRQFDATGIRSANQRIPKDLADGARAHSADEIVTWLYTRTAAPNYSESIMKVGAGNCDQMAHVAVDTINLSGGDARIAQVKGHTFAVVGGPKGGQITSGFKGPEWADAWVVDPWAGISCPAGDYRNQFEQRMQEWSRSGKQILISDGGTPPQSVWRDPRDPGWINATVHGDAQVF
jgi:hypothetical protein